MNPIFKALLKFCTIKNVFKTFKQVLKNIEITHNFLSGEVCTKFPGRFNQILLKGKQIMLS